MAVSASLMARDSLPRWMNAAARLLYSTPFSGSAFTALVYAATALTYSFAAKCWLPSSLKCSSGGETWGCGTSCESPPSVPRLGSGRTSLPCPTDGNSTFFLHFPLCPPSLSQSAVWHLTEQYTATLHLPHGMRGVFSSGAAFPHSKQARPCNGMSFSSLVWLSLNAGWCVRRSSRRSLWIFSAAPVLTTFVPHLLFLTSRCCAFFSFAVCVMPLSPSFVDSAIAWSMVSQNNFASSRSAILRMLSHSLLPSMKTFAHPGTPFLIPSWALWWMVLLRTVTGWCTSNPMKIPFPLL
mmetsp:Transcript_45261/g.106607  ORF Transcript_45261/g.106607 Transcript_45261/m.106607 type:complete len:295 (+) Transcript_45261:55-939(+)